VTLGFGVFVAGLAWARRAPGFVLALLLLAACVSVYDLINVGRVAGGSDGLFEVSVGIGLIASAAGSAVGLAGCWKQKGSR
jgi:hypothetical protein